MGGSEVVTRAAKTYFVIRIWSAPLVLINYVMLGWLIGLAHARGVALGLSRSQSTSSTRRAPLLLVLVLDAGIAGGGHRLGGRGSRRPFAWHCGRRPSHPVETRQYLERTLFDRDKLVHMLAVNRDIMIRTAALIIALLFFAAQGARAGDVALAGNAVLNNFLLVSACFLDGLANAAEQLCGQAYGARERTHSGAARLVIPWGFAFSLVVAGAYPLSPALIDIMTASGSAADRPRLSVVRGRLAAACGVCLRLRRGL